MSKKSIAVVGAGISGLTAARACAARGHVVTVFDKGRHPGGRVSTRRVADAGLAFDHGAPFFEVRSDVFLKQVRDWQGEGVVAEWQPGLYVGTPRMSALCESLGRSLKVQCSTTVVSVTPTPAGTFRLVAQESGTLGDFDAVVVTVPAPQAAALVSSSPELEAACRQAVMAPVWVAMVAFEASLGIPMPVRRFEAGHALSLAVCDSAKPLRSGPESWVLHAEDAFTRQHLEESAEWVADALVRQFLAAVGSDASPRVVYQKAHRWRYALAQAPFPKAPCLFDASQGLILAGDWLGGGNIEGAYLSGKAASGLFS